MKTRTQYYTLFFIAALCLCAIGLTSCKSNKIRAYTSKKEINSRATFFFPELDGRIDSLRKKYDLPGVTVAVVRNEKLVYINCYGVQDVETKTPTCNSNLFRIASISKPITVVALLKLMQEGRLAMDDIVFGEGGILGDDFGTIPENSDWNKITVKHLIDHKSGIRNTPNDPMFAYKGLTNKEIIERLIAERPLESKPGSESFYSNTGYNILGRVIEKLTNMTYEEYVKKEVFAPCGVTRMCIAGNTLSDRLPDEVTYFQPDEQGWTYGMDVWRMDAHGGWLASATDLARFIVHLDRNQHVPDIVSEEWLNHNYFGYEQWIHTGSLPGTATVLSRMNDEFSYVFLANRRSWDKSFFDDIISTMRQSIYERKEWSDVDLFAKVKW